MDSRNALRRLLSPAGFGLALLLFLLPFFTVSCGGPDTAPVDATFTGVDLLVGGAPDARGPGVDAGTQAEAVTLFRQLGYLDTEPLAVLAAIAVLVAMASALLRRAAVRHAYAAVLAVVAAALLAGAIARAAARTSEGLRRYVESGDPGEFTDSTRIRYGFWVVLGLLLFLATANLAAAVRAVRHPAPARPPDTTPPGGALATAGPPLPATGDAPPEEDDDEYWRRPA